MTDRPLSVRPPAAHRKLYVVGDGAYAFDCDDIQTMVRLSRVRRDRNGELRGDLQVLCFLAGATTLEDGTLDIVDNLNLSSPSARQHAAAGLERRAHTRSAQVDWRAILDDVSLRVRRAEESGDAAIVLPSANPAPADDVFDVDGLPLLKRQPTVWAAAGGTGKSTLALYAGGRLQQAGINVLFIDAELEAGDQRRRLEGLFGALAMPAVTYLRLTRPLAADVDRVARICHERSIGFVIVDSIAMASGGAIREEETAIAYNRALRTLGLGSLSIAHLPKPKDGQTDDQGGIFGSVYWFNLARSVWHLKQADASADESAITVGCFHKKANLGRLHRPLGFELRFDDQGGIRVRRVDLAGVEGLAAQLPLRMRIQHVLKAGTRTIAELASELEANEDSVKRTVNRYSTGKVIWFTRVPSTEGSDRIGLAETRRAS